MVGANSEYNRTHAEMTGSEFFAAVKARCQMRDTECIEGMHFYIFSFNSVEDRDLFIGDVREQLGFFASPVERDRDNQYSAPGIYLAYP